jgi:hypothetical protein
LSDEPLTLLELAAKFGVSRERTRQLEQRLKIRIRAYLQKELGDAFEVPVSAAGRRRGLAATEEMVETGMFEGTSYPMWVPEVAPSQVSS